jgi:flagellar basal body rod protein FlgG
LPDGSKAYTRSGELRIDPQGRLVTKQAHPILDANDVGIQLDSANHATLSITPNGEVKQGSDVKGTIELVEFENPRQLTPIGDGLFTARNPAAIPLPVSDPVLRQGFIETSSSSAVAEMASLIVAMRMSEANQRIIQNEDSRMERTIRELAGPI